MAGRAAVSATGGAPCAVRDQCVLPGPPAAGSRSDALLRTAIDWGLGRETCDASGKNGYGGFRNLASQPATYTI